MKYKSSSFFTTTIVFILFFASAVNAQTTMPPPPVEDKSQPDVTKPAQEDYVFEKIEVEAQVNMEDWKKHLQKNLTAYIEDAVLRGMKAGTYTVNVRFLVERDGRISNVKAMNDPGYNLARGAERVVRTGPKWIAGEQNGKKVRSYHTQPITFSIAEK